MRGKTFFRNLTIAIVSILFAASIVMAASTATQHHSRFGSLNILLISWTAAAGGAFTSYETRNINGMVWGVETDPGVSAPTASYDITLKDQYGLDIMGAKLADRASGETQFVQPYNTDQSEYLSMPVHGPLTVAISNNSVTAATGKIMIYYITE